MVHEDPVPTLRKDRVEEPEALGSRGLGGAWFLCSCVEEESMNLSLEHITTETVPLLQNTAF